METIRLARWIDFADTIRAVRKRFPDRVIPITGKPPVREHTRILFRGHTDTSWPLKTTLERRTDREFWVSNYMELVCRCVPELESFSGANWHVPDYPAVVAEIKARSTDSWAHLPAYDYLVYMRHHGFPSPLLDWTESPFIAAYFAFIDVAASDRAILCYVETPEGGKGGLVGAPDIQVRGPYVRTHPRHFAQKAWYTTATRWDAASQRHVFCPHEYVFQEGDESQNVLIKLELPASERQNVLQDLNDYNINHFTLFQSEESLVKTLESRLFDLVS